MARLLEAAYTGEFDSSLIEGVLARIADPNKVGLVRGPLGLGSTKDYVQMVLVRLHAVSQLDQAPNEMFAKARDAYRMTGPLADPKSTKIEVEGNLISLEELGTRQASFEEAMNRACIDLVTLLGLELSRSSRGAD